MKRFWLLALGAALILGCAAVWMGGLNQDEGWYLYAANLVREGKMPYRDFFYTQGPLLPIVYSAFAVVWKTGGLLAARLFNLALGFLGIVFACALARRLTKSRDGLPSAPAQAALVTFFLLATNLYHLYYLAIPKTYALASLFVLVGFYLLSFLPRAGWFAFFSGLSLAFAAGTRISLGALLAVVGFGLLIGAFRKTCPRFAWLWFGLGGALGLVLAYGPFLLDAGARAGLLAAQKYHAARGGSDLVWTVGSFSRLVRWYLPVFIVLGLGIGGLVTRGQIRTGQIRTGRDLTAREQSFVSALLAISFLAVFAVQMLAPFPYEDYQVPVMALLAVFAAVTFVSTPFVFAPVLRFLLVLGLCFAASFGSPLLERWMTNGQDRFWSLKKAKTELAQLRDVAQRIDALDPDGRTLLTQDLYLAVETNRKVPEGLEMGPFAMLDDAGWRKLLADAPKTCRLAALSGYTFAIEPPACGERPIERQLEYWKLLKESYEPVAREEAFGQNATPLLILKRR